MSFADAQRHMGNFVRGSKASELVDEVSGPTTHQLQGAILCWTHYSGSWLYNFLFAHFAGMVRSHSEPRSLTNICFFQVYAGTDCHPGAPTSALCRGAVVVLAWCQSLLKAHFPAKPECGSRRVWFSFWRQKVDFQRFNRGLSLIFFCASWKMKYTSNKVEFTCGVFFANLFCFGLPCFSIEQPRKRSCNLLKNVSFITES